MTTSHTRHLQALYAAISAGATGDDLRRFFHPDAEQVEYPNLFRTQVHRRRLEEMLVGAETGARIIRDQQYAVHDVVESGDRVAVQLTWTATAAVDLGDVPAGTHLVSHVAAFYVFREGLVLTQSSYDCYEPVPGRTTADV